MSTIRHGASIRHTINTPSRRVRPWLAPRQWAGLGVLAILIAAVFVASTTATAVLVALATCYLVISTLNNSYAAVRRNRADSGGTPSDYHAVPDAQLPRYTVIITALEDTRDLSNVVHQTINQVRVIDYPAAKLDSCLVIGQNIVCTVMARDALAQNNIRLIILPSSIPQTTAAACSYVVNSSDYVGDYTTVYRTNDVPDPCQLRQAIHGFSSAPTNVAALQAKLRCINVGSHLLTQLRAIEYERWFSNRAPILSQLGCIIPLARSSFHFRTALLREVDGWMHSAANIELSIALACNGYRVLMLDSYTSETDAENPGNNKQGWYEGYFHILAAQAQQPIRLTRELGLTSALRIFDITTGRPAAYLVHLGLWILLAIKLADIHTSTDINLLAGVGVLGLLLFLATNFLALMTVLEARR